MKDPHFEKPDDSAITTRWEMAEYEAIRDRRNSIHRDEETIRMRNDVAARNRKLARLMVVERLRDPWWWASKIVQPKVLFPAFFAGMLYLLMWAMSGR
ncbi:hypothetical protein [Opitutus terrae]|uniref:Uncharacterized protein n=1 Tax=Opitutus terrae (strain DSM 11246 / JCM 15787 / PB90-1) TaxID=452637 RepID=B2A063_OPITP|nr:hypothetical protein [Opitutus terrae]ACB77399.1 hypothetical protein Oter_4125 [Opitutus terrae PB90-1]